MKKILALFLVLATLAVLAQYKPKKGKEIDVICKMKVSNESKINTIYKEKAYYFCSEYCKETFAKTPEKYVKK